MDVCLNNFAKSLPPRLFFSVLHNKRLQFLLFLMHSLGNILLQHQLLLNKLKMPFNILTTVKLNL